MTGISRIFHPSESAAGTESCPIVFHYLVKQKAETSSREVSGGGGVDPTLVPRPAPPAPGGSARRPAHVRVGISIPTNYSPAAGEIFQTFFWHPVDQFGLFSVFQNSIDKCLYEGHSHRYVRAARGLAGWQVTTGAFLPTTVIVKALVMVLPE
jgi:hypothetical protein